MTPNNIRSFAGLNIKKVGENKDGVCIGFYGTGGSGKTTLASEIVLSKYGSPALLVDVEGGSSSVSHLMDKGLDVVLPANWNEVNKIRNEFKRGQDYYKSVIFDNLSEMQAMCMATIVPSGQPQIQHWGDMTARILQLVRDFRDLSRLSGLNVVFILWEEIEKEPLTEMVRKKVNLTPKLSAAIPGIITQMGRLTVHQSRPPYARKLVFAPSEETDSKFRVAPTDNAAKMPLELYLTQEVHFLVDFLAMLKDGQKFPSEKYARPRTNVQTQAQ